MHDDRRRGVWAHCMKEMERKKDNINKVQRSQSSHNKLNGTMH